MAENGALIQYIIAGLVAVALLARMLTGGLERFERALTPVLLCLALVAGLNYFYGLRSGGSWLHRWDLFHTATSARFSEELRYDGLYEAAFVVGTEETGAFSNVEKVRDLRTLEHVDAAGLLESRGVGERFSAERREAFARDIRFWRGLVPESRWRLLFKDKGYNGTPYVTVLAKLCFQGGELSRSRLVALSLIDVALLLIAFIFVARSFGLRVALVAFIFFCVSFPNRFTHMGGSVLRFSYVSWLMIAAAMLKDRRYGTAGVLIALAGMERVFPFLFGAGMIGKMAADSWRTGGLAPHYRRFLYGLGITTAACLAASTAVTGWAAWAEFYENMRLHSARSASFRIGLRHLFMLGGEGGFPEKELVFRARLLPFLLCAGLLFTPLLARVRRLSAPAFTVLFGLLSLFVFFYATRYYYSVLALLFLIDVPREGTRWRLGSWLLLFGITAATYGVYAYGASSALLYNQLFSALLCVYFAVVLAAVWLDGRAPVRAGRGAVLVPAVVTLVSLAMIIWVVAIQRSQALGPPERVEIAMTGQSLADATARVIRGDDATPRVDAEPCQAVYLAARRDGHLLAAAWSDSTRVGAALRDALMRLPDAGAATTFEVFVQRGRVPVQAGDLGGERMAPHHGLRGIELRTASGIERISSLEIVTRNLSMRAAYEALAPDGHAQAAVTEGEQLLVRPAGASLQLFRGATAVSLADVSAANVEACADAAGDWLIRQVGDDGRLRYMVHPSTGEESARNNMIRQWMGTIALIRTGIARDDRDVLALAAKNIRYNLEHFYREEGGLGLIEYAGKVKLGAVALAALALVEHPDREQYADHEAALLRTVEHLWNDDGSFHTFYRPADRDDGVNFYPGEALLLLATLYEQEPSEELEARIMESFRYYRGWHRAHRNPAFVPWHTQAYAVLWRLTRNAELLEFIFEMNDWLLGVQQWESALYPDQVGRFYDPARPGFGPPHASATGVYLEGLIEAWSLAAETNDGVRASAYRRAIVGGLRSLLQLQFRDDADMYYVTDRDRVVGGVRTRVDDSTIRVDNVQHGLMAMLRIVARFSAAGYQP